MHNLILIQILAKKFGSKEREIIAFHVEYETGTDHGNLEFV